MNTAEEETPRDPFPVQKTQGDSKSHAVGSKDHTADAFCVTQRSIGRQSTETSPGPVSLFQGKHNAIDSQSEPQVLPSAIGSAKFTTGTSFQQTFGPIMSFRDGFYFDQDGIRHVRNGEPRNYRYEQSITIGTANNSVSDDDVDNMVGNAIGHATGLPWE